MAETIAAGRHLLETVYRRPVMVKPVRMLKVRGGNQNVRPGSQKRQLEATQSLPLSAAARYR